MLQEYENMDPRPGTLSRSKSTPACRPRLARLEELAGNLWFSWDRSRALRSSRAWIRSSGTSIGHSPKAMLKSVDQRRLDEAARDPVFLHDFDRALAAYDAYHGRHPARNGGRSLGENDLVAYFCAEFGFHESLPIYSGGLGILAGDHCKTASDMGTALRRRGPALSPGLFPPDHRRRGHPARGLPRLRFQRPADHAGRARRRQPARGPGRVRRARRVLQGLARARRPHHPVPARHRPREEPARGPRDRPPPLRRRPQHAHPAGDRAGRRRRARARGARHQAHGLAHQRGPRGVPGAGAHARADAPGARSATPRSRRSPPTRSSPRTRRSPRGTTTSPPETVDRYFYALLPGAGAAARASCSSSAARPRPPTST